MLSHLLPPSYALIFSSCLSSSSSFLCICYAFMMLRMWRSVGILFSDFRDLLCLLNIFAMNTCFWHVSFHEGPDQCVNALQVLFSSHDFDCMVYLGWNCVLLDFMISLLFEALPIGVHANRCFPLGYWHLIALQLNPFCRCNLILWTSSYYNGHSVIWFKSPSEPLRPLLQSSRMTCLEDRREGAIPCRLTSASSTGKSTSPIKGEWSGSFPWGMNAFSTLGCHTVCPFEYLTFGKECWAFSLYALWL